MKTLLRFLALGAGMAVAAGCGGGGGGGDNLPAELAITPQNAVEVAGDVMVGVLDVGSLGVLGGSGLISADSGAGPAMSKLSPELAGKGVELIMMAPFGPEVVACDVSGTVTVSGNLASPDTLTPGDTITARFSLCDDGEGTVLNGTMTLRVTSFEGDLLAGFVRIGLSMGFQTLSVTEGSDIYTANGDLTLLMDTLAYPESTYTMSSDSLSVNDGTQTQVLSNFSLSAGLDESSQPAAYTLDASGRVGVTGQGTVSFDSLAPFAGFADTDPDSGVMYIEGAMSSSINATVLSNIQVQLEMDYDGNGTIDETRIVTWDELEG